MSKGFTSARNGKVRGAGTTWPAEERMGWCSASAGLRSATNSVWHFTRDPLDWRRTMNVALGGGHYPYALMRAMEEQ